MTRSTQHPKLLTLHQEALEPRVNHVPAEWLEVNPSVYKECPFPMNFHKHKTNARIIIYKYRTHYRSPIEHIQRNCSGRWKMTRDHTILSGCGGVWTPLPPVRGASSQSPDNCGPLERPLPSPGRGRQRPPITIRACRTP